MRKHYKEIIRFANSEEGTAVWFKHSTMTEWKKNYAPTWSKDTTYIVDDKFAELRKQNIDTGRDIQVYNPISSEWGTPTFKLEFNGNVKNYRLKPEKFVYPIYKRNRHDGYIVKFTGKHEGKLVEDAKHQLVYSESNWIGHTNTGEWEDVDYKEFKYPIYKKSKSTGAIVKFTSKSEGVIIEMTKKSLNVGYTSDRWIEHTDTNAWEDCDHKEPVYYYQWERRHQDGFIVVSCWETDERAEIRNNKLKGWKKIESSRRTWED